jgi:cyclopropane-fatty-acyl-phospholipid synthase
LDTAETLLEVGGGWGGLAVDLARRYPNLHITSLTVSDEQLKRAKQRAEDAGVADRIDFVGMDYRDLEVETPFDRVVSVEMIEAVDWRDIDEYFDSLARFVDPEKGVIVTQSINIKPEQFAQQKHNTSFANTAIFPGGVLIPKQEIIDGMDQRGWRKHEETELTPSYALTLREWIRNLYENKGELSEKWLKQGIQSTAIERFYRGFSFYLAVSEAGFRPGTGHLQDWQLAFRPAKIT